MSDPPPPTYSPSPSSPPNAEVTPPLYDADTASSTASQTSHTYTWKPKSNVEIILLLNTSRAPTPPDTSLASSSTSRAVPRQYDPLYYVGVGDVGGELTVIDHVSKIIRSSSLHARVLSRGFEEKAFGITTCIYVLRELRECIE